MAETVKPSIGSILDLQMLEKDVNDESTSQTWTCVSYASKMDER